MHTLASIVLLLVALTSSLAPSTVQGTVSERRGACSHFVVETQRGSDVLDWRQGYEPDLDDVIAGNFESYGFHDVVDETRGRDLRVYTEYFLIGERDASERLRQLCR